MQDFDKQGKATIARHPIHPMLVVFPIGFFVGSIACDIIYGATQTPFWYFMATWLIAFGVIGGLLAALSGFTDYFTARFTAVAKRTATLHLLVNLGLVVLYIVNFFLRLHNPGLTTGYLLSIIGLAALLYSGWLGGELVYVDHIGVSPAAAAPEAIGQAPPAEERQRPAA